MLNRLYIVVGVVVIIILLTAFLAPMVFPWEMLRARFQTIASEVAGAEVTISGDIHFTVLPEPRLEFSGVTITPKDAEPITVQHLAARFPLMNFLTDHYTVKQLQLDAPRVLVGIDEAGRIDSRSLGWPIGSAAVDIEAASITNGSITFIDRRRAGTLEASNLSGTLAVEGDAGGAIRLDLSGQFLGARHALTLASANLSADGTAPLALTLRNLESGDVTSLNGRLALGAEPAFQGKGTFRRPPVDRGADPLGEFGTLSATGDVELAPGRLLVGNLEVLPDENRPTMRLKGSLGMVFGATPTFDARLTGGVIAVGTSKPTGTAKDFQRALQALPVLPQLPVPGHLRLNVTQMDLGPFAFSSLEADLVSGGKGWAIASFSAGLPGRTRVSLKAGKDGGAERGRLELVSDQLDRFVALWQPVKADSPLLGLSGGLRADYEIRDGDIRLSRGQFTLGNLIRPFAATLRSGAAPALELSSDLGVLDAAESAALAALAPAMGALQGPKDDWPLKAGQVDLSAEQMVAFGQPVSGLRLAARWDDRGLQIPTLAAADFGGVALSGRDLSLASGPKGDQLSGHLSISAPSATASAVTGFYALNRIPEPVAAMLAGAFPLQLDVEADAPTDDGGQKLTALGNAGGARLSITADLAGGLLQALAAKTKLDIRVDADRASDATSLLGPALTGLMPSDTPISAQLAVEGSVGSGFKGDAHLSGGIDSLSMSGEFGGLSLLTLAAKGKVTANLADATGLAELAGLGGVHVPGFSGSADVSLKPGGTLQLDNIAVSSGGSAATGTLLISTSGRATGASGKLTIDRTDLPGLLALVAGPQVLLAPSPWPQGPIDLGRAERPRSGKIDISIAKLDLAGALVSEETTLTLDWTGTETRIADVRGRLAGGAVALTATICCTGPEAEKQVALRLSIDNATLGALMPDAVARGLSGQVSLSTELSGSGATPGEIVSHLSGSGVFDLSGLTLAGLDPAALVSSEDPAALLKLPPESQGAELESSIARKLGGAPFVADRVEGELTVVDGVLRSPNLSITGPSGRLFGGLTLRLADLGLEGSLEVQPSASTAPGLITPDLARAGIVLSGSLVSPGIEYDLQGLIDQILASVLEREADRLEQLRAAEAAAKQAAAEEAARAAALEAARVAAETATPPPRPKPEEPFNLLGPDQP